MKVFAITTLSDWYYEFGTARDEGLQRIVNLSKQAGVSRLYLRTHEGGVADYPSEVSSILVGSEAVKKMRGFGTYPISYFSYVQPLDYSKWDPVARLPEVAEEAGVEPAFWYTILEDDHGGSRSSQFLLENPDLRCKDREGNPISGCLEFWFREVREYKLAVIDELLEKGARRILLDLQRRNGQPSADGAGWYRYGFNPEIIEVFRKEKGLDPHTIAPGSEEWQLWVDQMAVIYTDFLLEVARRVRAVGGCVELLTWPVDLRSWMAIDLTRLAGSGLIEAVHVASHRYSYSPEEIRRQVGIIEKQVAGTGVSVIPAICGYRGMGAQALDRCFREIEDQGRNTVVVHEADAIWFSRVESRFRALANDVPHYRRALNAVPVEDEHPDWCRVEGVTGFLKGFKEQDVTPDQETSVKAAYTSEALLLRVACKERSVASLLPVKRRDPNNYNVLQLGARLYWNPLDSVHLFLADPDDADDYFHFIVDPEGKWLHEKRSNPDWAGAWDGTAMIGQDEWIALFRIPFASLGDDFAKGRTRRVHLVRAQSSPLEISGLNIVAASRPEPREFGALAFLPQT